jgi:hypothetical protein
VLLGARRALRAGARSMQTFGVSRVGELYLLAEVP